jgi:hypothetical protein
VITLAVRGSNFIKEVENMLCEYHRRMLYRTDAAQQVVEADTPTVS